MADLYFPAIDPVARRLARVPALEYIIVQAGQSNAEGWTGSFDPAIDVQDPRIRVMQSGKGLNLNSNPTFRTGTIGWSSPNGTISGGVQGYVDFTPSAATNPYLTRTITGLTVGTIYELEVDFAAITGAVQVLLNGATELVTSSKYVSTLGVYRVRWTATATSHDIRILSNSSATPVGALLFRLKRVELRPVLTTGASYPQAEERTTLYETTSTLTPLGTNPAMNMARRLLARGIASKVTIIPTAVGGTRLVGGLWDADTPGTLYTKTYSRLTAAMADNPNAIPVFTWLQGELDGDGGSDPRAYVEKFRTMIANLRGIAGCERMRVIVGGMVPEYVATQPAYQAIQDAHQLLPLEIPGTHFTPSPSGYQRGAGQLNHFTPQGARVIGALWGDVVDPLWL